MARRAWLAGTVTMVAAAACSSSPQASPTTAPAAVTSAATVTLLVTTTVVTTTTVAPTTTAPPTVAARYASALTQIQPTVFGLLVPAGVRDSVARLSLLAGAIPDPATTSHAVAAYASGAVSLSALAEAVLASPSYTQRHPASDPGRFVAGLYTDVLGRPADAAGQASWTAQMVAGRPRALVATAFTESAEAVARTGTAPPQAPPVRLVAGASLGQSDSVLRAYTTLLQRFPSGEELAGAVARYRSGTPLTTIVGDVLASSEYQARRGGLADDAFVDALYADVLGRAAEAEARTAHAARLGSGVSRAAVAVVFLESSEAVTRTGTAAPEPPPPPRPPAPPAGGSAGGGGAAAGPPPSGGVLALGDSVMLGAAGALRSAIPGIRVDAKVSRQLPQGTAILQALRASGQLPGTVVIHLGNNGTISGGACDALMGAAAGRRVVLVTIKVPRDYEDGNNAVLRSCAGRHGAAVADWSTAARSAPGLLAGDGYHLNGSGARLYARVVANAL